MLCKEIYIYEEIYIYINVYESEKREIYMFTDLYKQIYF